MSGEIFLYALISFMIVLVTIFQKDQDEPTSAAMTVAPHNAETTVSEILNDVIETAVSSNTEKTDNLPLDNKGENVDIIPNLSILRK